MLQWSDLHAADQDHFVGRATWPLLSGYATAGTRALVLGPHDPDLVEGLLAAGVEATLLLRSFPDAQEISERFGDEPRLVIECGAFHRYKPETPYDLVVALGDLDTVHSPDG